MDKRKKERQQTHEQKVDAKTHTQTMANMITITCSQCGLDLRGCVCVMRERGGTLTNKSKSKSNMCTVEEAVFFVN